MCFGNPFRPDLHLICNPFRPVFAIFEVDTYRVDPAQRSKVKEEVMLALGPPDPTIVVETEASHQLSVQELLAVFKQHGEVVLVR